MKQMPHAELTFAVLWIALPALTLAAAKKAPPSPPPTLDQHVQEVNERFRQSASATPGSLYFATGRLSDSVRDVRASQVYDLLTIVVLDNSSAVSTGVTNTARKSSVAAAVTSLAGPKSPTGALANLANASNNTQLQGQGTTSRGTTLSTTVTAEVTAVLPNGNLVVKGQKEISVNSEKQVITIQGIVRPDDLSPVNSVPSDRVARIEILVNGKGVVNDAVKRPFVLYRLLLGLLPF
jgi:flagellar L-ring protein precursor FlgH